MGTYRRWRNSPNGEDPVDLIRDATADFPKVQPRNVLGRINIRSVRQSLSDEHGVVNPLELLSCAEVPDGRNASSGVGGEKVLRQDHVLGNDVGEGLDQLLDGDTLGARAVPEVEQVVVDSRYEIAV